MGFARGWRSPAIQAIVNASAPGHHTWASTFVGRSTSGTNHSTEGGLRHPSEGGLKHPSNARLTQLGAPPLVMTTARSGGDPHLNIKESRNERDDIYNWEDQHE